MTIDMKTLERLRRYWSHWPEPVRAGWEGWLLGQVPVDSHESGPPDNPRSVTTYAHGFSYCLAWASRVGLEIDWARPEITWKRVTLRQMATDARAYGDKPNTARAALHGLERVFAAVYPTASRRFIRRELKKIARSGDDRAKRARLVDTNELVEFGIALMRAAHAAPASIDASLQFEVGMQIALLALRPFRLRIFTGMELALDSGSARRGSVVLVRDGVSYVLMHKDRERGRMSPYNPYRRRRLRGGKLVPPLQDVPKNLTEWLDLFLTEHRPRLCQGYAGPRLWLSVRGAPPTANAIYKRISKATRARFGRSICPQLFRDCHATSVSRRLLDDVSPAHAVLGHTPEMTSSRYEQADVARSIAVGRLVADIMDSYAAPPTSSGKECP